METAQTSHDTDQIIRSFVEQDSASADTLTQWMRSGTTSVLRVNAAGIIAKLGTPESADSVVVALRGDREARHLYLTAVAHRILRLPWSDALRYVGDPSHGEGFAAMLTAELRNPRDAAARWCSAVLLSRLDVADRDPVKAAIANALCAEDSRENLRAMAALLAGTDPITA